MNAEQLIRVWKAAYETVDEHNFPMRLLILDTIAYLEEQVSNELTA